jgi:hypothetical protein
MDGALPSCDSAFASLRSNLCICVLLKVGGRAGGEGGGGMVLGCWCQCTARTSHTHIAAGVMVDVFLMLML